MIFTPFSLLIVNRAFYLILLISIVLILTNCELNSKTVLAPYSITDNKQNKIEKKNAIKAFSPKKNTVNTNSYSKQPYELVYRISTIVGDQQSDIQFSLSKIKSPNYVQGTIKTPFYPLLTRNYFTHFVDSVNNQKLSSTQYLAITNNGIARLPQEDVSILFNPVVKKPFYSRLFFSLNSINYYFENERLNKYFKHSFGIYKKNDSNSAIVRLGAGLVFQDGLAFILSNANKTDFYNLQSIVYVAGQLTPIMAVKRLPNNTTLRFEPLNLGFAVQDTFYNNKINKNNDDFKLTSTSNFSELKPSYSFEDGKITSTFFNDRASKSILQLYSFETDLKLRTKPPDLFSDFRNNFFINVDSENIVFSENTLNLVSDGFPSSFFINLNSENIFISPYRIQLTERSDYGISGRSTPIKVQLEKNKQSYLFAETRFYGLDFNYLVITYDLVLHVAKQKPLQLQYATTIRNWGFQIFINSSKLDLK